MKFFASLVCVLLLIASSARGQAPKTGKVPSTGPLAFNTTTPLSSRIIPSPIIPEQSVSNLAKPSLRRTHTLTENELAQVQNVLQQLPSFSREVFTQHLRSLSFVDGIPGNGTTSEERGTGTPVFNIVLRAGLLNENISSFLIRKERGYYAEDDSGVSVSVEAGSLPAILYVLVHESVHVLDISNRMGVAEMPELSPGHPAELLIEGIWENPTTKASAYQSPPFAMSWFGVGKPALLSSAQPTYRMLARTPFVSLYGSSSWYEDIAELVTCYYLTQKLNQPYRIVLRRGSETQYALSPMDGTLVRARFPYISTLFS